MIRIARKEEVEKIAQLAHLMWTSDIEDLVKDFTELLDNDEAVIFVAEEKEQIIGFAQCQLRHDYVEGTDSSPVGYLEGVFVKKEFRNQGYAKFLLKECEKWSRKKGCDEFASDCELTNDASLKFHLKVGFEEANRIICFTKKL